MIDLKAFRRRNKLTQKEISEKSGIDQARISKYESGKELSDAVEDALIESYPSIKDFIIEDEPNPQIEEATRNAPNVYFVPLDAKAGFLSEYDENIFEEDIIKYYDPTIRFKAICFPVTGDSMADTLDEGDYLYCTFDPVSSPNSIKSGFIYVVVTKSQGILVKRIVKQNTNESIFLESDNEDYDIIELNTSEILKAYYVRRVRKFRLDKKMRYE